MLQKIDLHHAFPSPTDCFYSPMNNVIKYDFAFDYDYDYDYEYEYEYVPDRL